MIESSEPLHMDKDKVEHQHQVEARQIFAKNEFIQCIHDMETKEKASPTFCIPPGGGKTLSILQAALHRPKGLFYVLCSS